MKRQSTLRFVFALLVWVISSCSGPDHLEEGVTLRVYEVEANENGEPLAGAQRPDFGQTPNLDVKIAAAALVGEEAFYGYEKDFLAEMAGSCWVKKGGKQVFEIEASGGCLVFLGKKSKKFFEEGGGGKTRWEVEADQGELSWRVFLTHAEGDPKLRVKVWPQGKEGSPWPVWTEKGVTRVVAPGKKRVYGRYEPGHGASLEKMHPSFRVERLRPKGFEPLVGGLALLPDGRLGVATFPPVLEGHLVPLLADADHKIYALDIDEGIPLEKRQAEVIADGLVEPCGLCVVGEDLFVSGRFEITRLRDQDKDGFYEEHTTMASGWGVDNFHHFTFGLIPMDGYLYASLSTSIALFQPRYDGLQLVSRVGPNPQYRGSVFRTPIDKENNTELEYITGGLRTPNGMGIGPRGELLVCDNQGGWLSASKLVEIKPGEFHGHYNVVSYAPDGKKWGHDSLFVDQPPVAPMVYFPHGRAGLSPSVMVTVPKGEFEGQLLVGDVTYGGLRRVFLEEIEGQRQGCVFRFGQGLECGINRMIMDEQGALYIGGTGGGGNWGWRGTTFGLQKLVPTNETTFEYEKIELVEDGFVIRYTREIAPEVLELKRNIRFRSNRYIANPGYGGFRYRRRTLKIQSLEALPDGKSVKATLSGLQEGTVVHISTSPVSKEGQKIWSSDAWYTISRLPGVKREKRAAQEREEAFEPLIEHAFHHWTFAEGNLRCWSYENREFQFLPYEEDLGAVLEREVMLGDKTLKLQCRGGNGAQPWVGIVDAQGKERRFHFGMGDKLREMATAEDASNKVEWIAVDLNDAERKSMKQSLWYDVEGARAADETGSYDDVTWLDLSLRVEGEVLMLTAGGREVMAIEGHAIGDKGECVLRLGVQGDEKSEVTGFSAFREIGLVGQ